MLNLLFFGARKGKRRRSFDLVNKADERATELGKLTNETQEKSQTVIDEVV